MTIDQTQLAHVLMVLLAALAALVALMLVLRHLASMRVTTAEVAKLRAEWSEGSLGIANSHKALDAKHLALNNEFIHLRNRIGK